MTVGTFSEYARHVGVTPQRVHRLHRSGRLVMLEGEGGRPLVDFEASDARVAASADLEKAGNGANAKRGPRAPMPGRPPKTPPEQAERIGAVFRQSQAQLKLFHAKRAELEFRKSAGELVERAAAERGIFDAFRALRTRIMLAPRRVASVVAPLSDAREIEAQIAEELRRCFEEFESHVGEVLRTREAPG